MKGKAEEKTYKFNRRSVTGLTNPWLIVDVLTDSTRDFDLSEKLNDYKQIPSLQQIIFVEQDSAWASTYIRVSEKEWRNLDLTSRDDESPLLDQSISLEQVYQQIL